MFAAALACLVDDYSSREKVMPIHFRIGIDTGKACYFRDKIDDKNYRWNLVGPGITGAERVLSAMGKDVDDVVYLSDRTRHKIMDLKESNAFAYRSIMHMQNRGRRADKHGQKRRIYELNHIEYMRPSLDS